MQKGSEGKGGEGKAKCLFYVDEGESKEMDE